ncbi:ECF transporter S component [Lentilactobacillus senioris]|uniref:ECF transporter S component n=1 Tax=Lentilactobacillus senioris TaxID=931534 RepID=UPI000A45E887|nr:ECF transporter S component [Lentilactobacillus senioris]
MVKQRSELRQMIIAAVLIAVNVVVSRVFVIPVPMTNGYLNLSDGLIIVAALLMGTKWGAAVGGP